MFAVAKRYFQPFMIESRHCSNVFERIYSIWAVTRYLFCCVNVWVEIKGCRNIAPQCRTLLEFPLFVSALSLGCLLVFVGWGGSYWDVGLMPTLTTSSRHNTSYLTGPKTLFANNNQWFQLGNLSKHEWQICHARLWVRILSGWAFAWLTRGTGFEPHLYSLISVVV